MSIKDFRGQVKISDVQAAFNEIVGRINNTIDIYNAAAEAEDMDYTKGSPKLSAAGYTLTIGGLKTILDGYSNTLIGCNVFKINDTTCLITDGLYITSDEVYRIKSRYVSGQSGWDMNELYYDIDNDAVMFKDGTNEAIVEVETSWTQPTITSNTTCGTFNATINAQNAYNCTNSSGFAVSLQGSNYSVYTHVVHYLAWYLPKTIKGSTLTFTVSRSDIAIIGELGLTVYADGVAIWSGIGSGTKTINLNNREINKISIGFSADMAATQYDMKYTKVSNLRLTGVSSSYAVDAGGTITPSDNIIKICDLNWNGKDGLIKDIKAFKLTELKDYKLQDTNKTFGNQAFCYDGLSTTNSGKFATYEYLHTRGDNGSDLSILGLELFNSPKGANYDRTEKGTNPFPKLYIPKGATDNMVTHDAAGRMVTNPFLKKIE